MTRITTTASTISFGSSRFRFIETSLHQDCPRNQICSRSFLREWLTRTHQAALRPETTVTGSAALAVRGFDASIFISDQSYGNSRPQSRHTTYVPVADAAATLGGSLPRTVM